MRTIPCEIYAKQYFPPRTRQPLACIYAYTHIYIHTYICIQRVPYNVVNRLGGDPRAKIKFCHLHSNGAPCQQLLLYIFVRRIISPNFADYLLLSSPELAEYICQIFKPHFVENKTSYEKVLF